MGLRQPFSLSVPSSLLTRLLTHAGTFKITNQIAARQELALPTGQATHLLRKQVPMSNITLAAGQITQHDP